MHKLWKHQIPLHSHGTLLSSAVLTLGSMWRRVCLRKAPHCTGDSREKEHQERVRKKVKGAWNRKKSWSSVSGWEDIYTSCTFALPSFWAFKHKVCGGYIFLFNLQLRQQTYNNIASKMRPEVCVFSLLTKKELNSTSELLKANFDSRKCIAFPPVSGINSPVITWIAVSLYTDIRWFL